MNVRIPNILAVGVVSITLTLALGGVARMDSQWALDRAYRASEPVIVRNEWGQQHKPSKWMCEATIKQWMEICDE